MTEPWNILEEERLWDYITKRKLSYAIVSHLMARPVDSLKDKMVSLRQIHESDWVEDERVAFLDIESSHLKSNIGIMLCWSLKHLEGRIEHDAIKRDEAIDRKIQDRRIVASLVRTLDKVDLIVTYYGTGFDVPFIRTRAMMQGIIFPGRGELRHFDVYYAVRNKMRLHSNRLAVAAETLGIEGKTPLPPRVWQEARLGYKDAIKYAQEHCDADVNVLEKVYNEILPFVGITRKSV